MINNPYSKLMKNSEKHEQPALSHDALLAKSCLYAQRALHAKGDNQADAYQLWAALALELLGKASLARIHPSLIVETANPNSLLEANGISTGTVVRTVDANIVFARLKHTVPHFGTPIAEACRSLATRRNAELHSGHAAFSGMPLEAWEGDFWSAAQLILTSMKLDLDAWLGADSRVPLELLQHVQHVKREAARRRVNHAAMMFEEKPGGGKRSKKEKEDIRNASKMIHWWDCKDKFRYLLNKVWNIQCPACKCIAFVGGDMISEELVDDQSHAEPGWEVVEREYLPVEFFCSTCGLSLVGEEALDEVGLGNIYLEAYEREIEYEPDYGND